jgi:acyl-CoA synthetase (AMP-forming)/AMP-acid ligase II
VLLHVLVSRATLVAPPTSQARDVIDTMRESEVTHVSATPTFWRVLVGGLDAETAAQLSLEQITLGGEAVPSALLERLRSLFPDTPISQVYGATEFGTVISVNDGLPGLPRSVLEPHEGREPRMRIVDGELQIKPTVGMVGYHGGAVTTGEWMKTGDLVQERDGRVHFVGRTSEIINVGGAKVHPLPIEDLAGSVEGVELVVAYGRPNPVTGQIVALDVVATPGADTDAIEAEIHKACQSLTRAARPRRITFVDELDVHGSKVRRGRPA